MFGFLRVCLCVFIFMFLHVLARRCTQYPVSISLSKGMYGIETSRWLIWRTLRTSIGGPETQGSKWVEGDLERIWFHTPYFSAILGGFFICLYVWFVCKYVCVFKPVSMCVCSSLGGDSQCRIGIVVVRSMSTHTRSKPSFHTYSKNKTWIPVLLETVNVAVVQWSEVRCQLIRAQNHHTYPQNKTWIPVLLVSGFVCVCAKPKPAS